MATVQPRFLQQPITHLNIDVAECEMGMLFLIFVRCKFESKLYIKIKAHFAEPGIRILLKVCSSIVFFQDAYFKCTISECMLTYLKFSLCMPKILMKYAIFCSPGCIYNQTRTICSEIVSPEMLSKTLFKIFILD